MGKSRGGWREGKKGQVRVSRGGGFFFRFCFVLGNDTPRSGFCVVGWLLCDENTRSSQDDIHSLSSSHVKWFLLTKGEKRRGRQKRKKRRSMCKRLTYYIRGTYRTHTPRENTILLTLPPERNCCYFVKELKKNKKHRECLFVKNKKNKIRFPKILTTPLHLSWHTSRGSLTSQCNHMNRNIVVVPIHLLPYPLLLSCTSH